MIRLLIRLVVCYKINMVRTVLVLKNLKKDQIATVRLRLPGAGAKMGAPISPVLGPYGINLNDFCRKFNEKTVGLSGVELLVEVFIFKDKSFEFNVKNLTVSLLVGSLHNANELDLVSLLKLVKIRLHQKNQLTNLPVLIRELKMLLGGLLSFKNLKINV